MLGLLRAWTVVILTVAGLLSGIWLVSTVAVPAAASHPAPASPCWSGAWQPIASYPVPSAYVALTTLGGQIYGFGGGGAYHMGQTGAYRYDPAAGWTRLADLPQGLTGMSAVSDGIEIYLLNGSSSFGSGSVTAVLYRYDPGTNAYTPLATPPLATAEQTAVYLNGKIYRIAGDAGLNETPSVDVYTIATNTWAPAGTIAPYPDGRYGLAAITDGQYIYAGGGVYGFAINTTYRYDPATNTWSDTAVTDFPHTFGLAASVVLDGRWLVAGGYQDQWASAGVWALDLADPTGPWEILPALPAPRRGVAGAVLGASFYTVAGSDTLDNDTADANRYDEAPCATATPTVTGTPPTSTPSATETPLPAPAACLVSWQPVPVPSVGPLIGVAADSATDAWAVEQPYSGTAILHWDGAAWGAVPPPTSTLINAIAANGPADAWVVGTGYYGYSALAAHWDGHTWQTTCCSATRPSAYGSWFSGAAVSGPDDAWVVGGWGNSGSGDPLAYHCTSAGCQNQSPSFSSDGELAAVTALGPNEVWVAGAIHEPPDPPGDVSYLGHFNGAWTAIPCPDIGYLTAVAASGSDDVWALSSGHAASLLHWDGHACREVPLAAPASGVVALAPDNAWAAGSAIQHWDGTAWSVVPGPPGLSFNSLAAAGPSDIWAVGQDTQNQGAIAHYAVPPVFADVPLTQPFYRPIEDLACRGLISGYTCGGPGEPCQPPTNLPYYRVGAHITRGQLVKLVVNAAGWPLVQPLTPTFADVPATQPFYAFVETAVAHGIISGYTCGGPGEPCDGQGRPYFRPNANITRSQLAKLITLARGYPIPAPATPTFADVPAASPFYGYVEAAAAAGLISGYTCGGPGEPCDPAQRPYFRPGNPATRGQTAKIVAAAFIPGGPPRR